MLLSHERRGLSIWILGHKHYCKAYSVFPLSKGYFYPVNDALIGLKSNDKLQRVLDACYPTVFRVTALMFCVAFRLFTYTLACAYSCASLSSCLCEW